MAILAVVAAGASFRRRRRPQPDGAVEPALARSGVPRLAHETPVELFRRVLLQRAKEPGQVLTELFEQARFSAEPMDETDKRRAITALEALRRTLAGRATAPG